MIDQGRHVALIQPHDPNCMPQNCGFRWIKRCFTQKRGSCTIIYSICFCMVWNNASFIKSICNVLSSFAFNFDNNVVNEQGWVENSQLLLDARERQTAETTPESSATGPTHVGASGFLFFPLRFSVDFSPQNYLAVFLQRYIFKTILKTNVYF